MKTLTYIEGNLLTGMGIDAIGHQANCQNVFGSGIARTIAHMYPEAYVADTEAKIANANRLGLLSFADIEMFGDGTVNRHGNNIQRIYNLYGQNLGTDYKKLGDRRTDYEGLYAALERMFLSLKEFNQKNGTVARVGFPYLMGSALGGGNWDIVSRLIEVTFRDYKGEVFIVKLKV